MYGNGALSAPATGDVTAAEALSRLEAWHASVATMGRAILAKYRAAGTAVPCNVRSQQNALVSGYLRAARAVYDQLAAKGVPVTQHLIDAAGVKRVLMPSSTNPFPRPVAPLAFTVSDCAGADQGLGFGVVPFVAVAVLAGAAVVSMIIGASALAERIRWPGNPPEVIAAYADQYRKCLAETKNAAGCAGLLPPPSTTSWWTIGITTVIVAGVVIGGIYLWKTYSPYRLVTA